METLNKLTHYKNIIELELTDVLKNEGFVTSFEIDTRSKNMIVGLNHIDKNKQIVSKIYSSDWIKTKKTFEQTFKDNGIEEKKRVELLFDFVNDNYKQIISLLTSNEVASTSEELYSLARENIRLFFKDQNSISYAYVKIMNKDGMGEHKEVVSIESKRFERYLAKLYFNKYEKTPNIEAIKNVVLGLLSEVEFGYKTIPLNLRVGWKDPTKKDTICYDSTDEYWRHIRVSKNGWKIMENNGHDDNNNPIFVRYNTQNPQVEPSRDYEPGIFDSFFKLTNVKNEDDIRLLKVYIVSLFIPDIPKVILQLCGDQGSGKTIYIKLVKMLVDPGKPSLLTISGDKNEFIQQLAHNYILCYDNLKHESYWLSDETCKASTGIGNTKRALYTNDEDFIFEYKRSLIFSALNIPLTEPDAMDRSIVIELDRIKKENKTTEEKIVAAFEELKPKLLGYIFDVLVKALQIKESLKLDNMPRMADFALWGEVIGRAMDYEPLDFLNIYYKNIGKQNIVVIDSNPLGLAIIKFSDKYLYNDNDKDDNGDDDDQTKKLEWSDLTRDFHKKLEDIANENNIDTNNKFWPKSTNSLVKKIKKFRSNLLEGFGIDITFGRDNDNVSTIRITKTKTTTKNNSSSSDQEVTENISRTSGSPETQKSCSKSSESSGGIETSPEVLPPEEKVSPEHLDQNCAQNDTFRRSGDTGDISGNLREETDTIFDDDISKDKDKDRNMENQLIEQPSSATPSSITPTSTAIVYPESREGIYRLHPHRDTWVCNYCDDKGDKWYMLVHVCKNKKDK